MAGGRRTRRAVCAVVALGAGTALTAGLAHGAVPTSLQGTFTRHFSFADFPNSEEPTGTYTMKITPSRLIWTARGLGVSTEQATVRGRLLLVRDQPGSLGRLCAENGWGTYRYSTRGKSISFLRVKDPCKERGEVLGKTWTRAH